MSAEDDPAAMGILITGGDWAAMLRDAEVLAQVCRTLFPLVTGALQVELTDIAKLCTRDLDEAILRWATLSSHLRARILIDHRGFSNVVAKA